MRFKEIKPEKRVEQEVRGMCLELGITVDVFDSKGTYSQALGRYTESQGMPSGVADLLGLDLSGIHSEIELKSPGQEDVCRLNQHQRLSRVIESNGFACVVSSGPQLKEIYLAWRKLWSMSDHQKAKELLLSKLPRKVLIKVGKSTKILVLSDLP